MIKAVLRGGVIYPIESIPPEWVDGKELFVDEGEPPAPRTSEEITQWRKELDATAAQLDDPREWDVMEATLAEADKQAKAFVRRQMGHR